MLTFPVEHGATMNMIAFATNDREDWPGGANLTLPTTKAEALDDFRQFGQNVKNIIRLSKDYLDRVSSARRPFGWYTTTTITLCTNITRHAVGHF